MYTDCLHGEGWKGADIPSLFLGQSKGLAAVSVPVKASRIPHRSNVDGLDGSSSMCLYNFNIWKGFYLFPFPFARMVSERDGLIANDARMWSEYRLFTIRSSYKGICIYTEETRYPIG